MSTYKGVKRLAVERPEWIPKVLACLECHKKYGEFAGNWVRKLLEEKEGKKIWFPGLRTLVSYGILKKVDTARGGRRAYYILIEPEEVEKALRELGYLK
ncbi:MAG TPA: hypothetical protein ENI40_00210 [Candidatus Desulfofervidus auxilii]|nr:hypothetical protein [Candidatus Desulfofervidus auxilii]